MIDIDSLVKTPSELAQAVACNMRSRRKAMKISQRELSSRSGVSYASLRRFEDTGKISLESLIALALVLEARDDIEKLFTQRYYRNIQEVIDENRK